MNKTYQEKLKTVQLHISNNDLSLAFRLLVDCVLDVKSVAFYKAIIALTEWRESALTNDLEYIERLQQLVQELSHIQLSEASNSSRLLSAKQLSKRYGSNRFQLGPIDMEIQTGEVWGLVGENGNGKTTLLRMLAKDLKTEAGTLEFPFYEGSSLYDLRTQLTYIPQRTPKWFGSLKSNLKFAANHYGIKGEENELLVLMMIIRFGLWNYRNHQWSELSSGYKMRFELARTFLRAPKILLLDEPLANLDVLAQQLILEDLKSLSKSISNPIGIILSSQQLFEVEKIADKVLFLRNGVPTFLNELDGLEHSEKTVIEFDCAASREEIQKAFATLKMVELHFNGGIYIVTFEGGNLTHAVMQAFIDHQIEVKYLRDISKSTRRLFLK